MTFPGAAIEVTCGECGEQFNVAVEGSEPENLPPPGAPPPRFNVEFLCPTCGDDGTLEVMIGQTG